MSELFRITDPSAEVGVAVNAHRVAPEPANTNDNEAIESSARNKKRPKVMPKISSLRQFVHFMCPTQCLCLCFKPNRRERIMASCRDQYFREIDIVEHIMQFREVRAELAADRAPPTATV